MVDASDAEDSQGAHDTGKSGDLVLSLDGFEGPIDLLLNLAREQKVDLSTLSILPLAEQYLAFIMDARRLRLELAADYLVMAAWLAYLKSRLLLPEPEPEKNAEDPAAMAAALKFQLLRLEAMQKVAQQLEACPQLGCEVFLRGYATPRVVEERPHYYLTLNDLMIAIAAPHRRRKPSGYAIAPVKLYSLEDTVMRLRTLLGNMPNWSVLSQYLPVALTEDIVTADPLQARSAIASTFAATLELVKNGDLELRQDGTFAPIYMRRRSDAEPDDTTLSNPSSLSSQ